MIVEDHDELREVTVAALRSLEYNACGVESAEALEAVWTAFRPHLLVLDLNLPGEDGLSLAQRIRAAAPDVGIIMVTVREQLHEKIAGYLKGADIYLNKPTSIEELHAAIQALSRRLDVSVHSMPSGSIHTGDVLDSASIIRDKAIALHDFLVQSEGKLPTLDELGRRFGLSPKRLNEVFTDIYGSSIYVFISTHRLNLAREAILNSDIPLKVLAYRLGYKHVNHFNTMFTKKFGCTPGALRKNRQED